MFNLESEVGSPVELPAMMEKFGIVLLAACRATRQIPEDHLDWESPEGQRTIWQFTTGPGPNCLFGWGVHQRGPGPAGRGRAGRVGFERAVRYGEEILHRVRETLSGDRPLDQ